MKTIFASLVIIAISISAQALPTGGSVTSGSAIINQSAIKDTSGITGTNVKITQIGDNVSITGDNIIINSSSNPIAMNHAGSYDGCGGGCITSVGSVNLPEPTLNYQQVNQSSLQTVVTFSKTSTINAPNINALSYHEAKQLNAAVNVSALSNLNKLSPSAGVHGHPELMNLSTVEDDAHLSAANK